MRSGSALLASLVIATSSCIVGELDLTGRPCPCGAGYTCIADRCIREACASDLECGSEAVCASSRCELPQSCLALKRAHAATPSGSHLIAPGDRVYCDMDQDGGGWMLVTPALIDSEINIEVSIQRDTEAYDGLRMTVQATADGCGGTTPKAHQVVFVKDRVPWQKIRFREQFSGRAACWSIFGDRQWLPDLDPNLYPFDRTLDVIRDALHMGGTNGDAFDGRPTRCDADGENFWVASGPDRSATVILRRKNPAALAGLATSAECLTMSVATWTYSDVYVREE